MRVVLALWKACPMIFATMKAQMLETFIGLKHNLIEKQLCPYFRSILLSHAAYSSINVPVNINDTLI
jgi:hypothetical protein